MGVWESKSNMRQETAEDSKAGLLQLDLENRQYQGQGQSYHRNQWSLLLHGYLHAKFQVTPFHY